ncbi:hypothetical protein [Tsukamurella sp. NPDC003166]|uniref:hypothetical protein n=1 Tax=Tsukamurella sp. NPDC003166 TaxID=3154444 RepID=UPI0033B2EDB8
MTGERRGELEAVRKAKRRFLDVLMANPDVFGVGVGRRRVAGEHVDQYAIVVHVRSKLPLHAVPGSRLIPAEVTLNDGAGPPVVVPVDVQEHAAPVPESVRIRPVPGGVSAGATGSGTIGGWVWDTVTKQIVALSNAHVFGTDSGTPVLQPSKEDGGMDGLDLIASVLRSGSLDAAIAAPVSSSIISAVILGGGAAVYHVGEPAVGMHVQKTARSSGVTFGVVDLIDFDSGYFDSHSDIWVDGVGADFSVDGDSGALYFDADALATGCWKAIGLHWGGSGNAGVGHHIQAVFTDLGLATLPTSDSAAPALG